MKNGSRRRRRGMESGHATVPATSAQERLDALIVNAFDTGVDAALRGEAEFNLDLHSRTMVRAALEKATALGVFRETDQKIALIRQMADGERQVAAAIDRIADEMAAAQKQEIPRDVP